MAKILVTNNIQDLLYRILAAIFKDIQGVEMEGHITGSKALCFESIVKRVSRNRPTVHGKEYILPVRCLAEAHKVTKPAFNAATLIIIATRTLLIIFSMFLDFIWTRKASQ